MGMFGSVILRLALINEMLVRAPLTLFYTGGGPFMPAGQEMCCGAQEIALKLLPLHDFVPLDLSQVLVESFVGFSSKNFELLDFEDT